MHFRTHVKAENRGKSGQDEYSDGMVEHDAHVGVLLKKLDDLGIANNTIVFYSTDNGPHYNTWPDAGTTPFRSEKNSNWEGAYRVPAFVRWPGHFPAGQTLNGIVAHEDWLPTFARRRRRCPTSRSGCMKGGDLRTAGNTALIRRLQPARLPERQGQGVAAQRVLVRQRRRPDRRRALRRLEGRLPGEPRRRRSASGASRSSNCACRCCSTCAAIRSRRPSTTRTPTTTGSSIGRSCSCRSRVWRRSSCMTMKDYPPSQTPGSFNLSKIEEQLRRAN